MSSAARVGEATHVDTDQGTPATRGAQYSRARCKGKDCGPATVAALEPGKPWRATSRGEQEPPSGAKK
jgi:hypothetical protein